MPDRFDDALSRLSTRVQRSVAALTLSLFALFEAAAFFHYQALVVSLAVGFPVMAVVYTRYLLFGILLRPHLPDTMSGGAMWRSAVTILAVWLALPATLIFLGASGGISYSKLFLGYHGSHGFWVLPEGLCVIGVVALVVVVPEYLRIRGRATAADSPVPAWLAGFASVLTGAYILLLHFGGGELRKPVVGVVSVVAFTLAAVLAPFYWFVVKACLRSGIAVVFEPGQWWSAWRAAYREMRGVQDRKAGS